MLSSLATKWCVAFYFCLHKVFFTWFFFSFSLQERQQQWKVAEKERIASLPDPTIPEGHSLMPEDDRLKTFNMLKKCE